MTVTKDLKELKESASIVALLDRLGYKPTPKRGREAMYISMLRDNDTNPSFSVNDQMGVWYDHGSGKGGNIIDFGIAYWEGLKFSEVIAKLKHTLDYGTPAPHINRIKNNPQKPNYIVHQTKPLGTHPAISDYLESRGVYQVAKPFLKEVYYYVEDDIGNRKYYFSAGWQNEALAWEVRNRMFKGCMGPKAITFIANDPKKAAVFEGFLDFLSWKIEHPEDGHSIIVLNAVTMIQQAISKCKSFSTLDLYFDRDKAGILATREFTKALPYASDKSKAYEGFNDYNDKIVASASEVPAAILNELFAESRSPTRR